MGDFVSTDPRGVVVLLKESTFSRHIETTHKELQGECVTAYPTESIPVARALWRRAT